MILLIDRFFDNIFLKRDIIYYIDKKFINIFVILFFILFFIENLVIKISFLISKIYYLDIC